jgi:hypothetical protein
MFKASRTMYIFLGAALCFCLGAVFVFFSFEKIKSYPSFIVSNNSLHISATYSYPSSVSSELFEDKEESAISFFEDVLLILLSIGSVVFAWHKFSSYIFSHQLSLKGVSPDSLWQKTTTSL